MNIPLAIEAYGILNRPSFVRKLVQLEYVEEWNLLAGHLLTLLGDRTDRAQVVWFVSFGIVDKQVFLIRNCF